MTPARLLAAAAVVTMAAFAQPSDVERQCQELNNTQRAKEAAHCYAELQRTHDDPSLAQRAALGQARNETWSGQARAAQKAYAVYLRANPSNRDVTIEYIRLLRYEGHYRRAERLCNQLLRSSPRDAEVLALRAEVLYWARNRSFQARSDAERALMLAPGSMDARASRMAALEALGLNRAVSEEAAQLPESNPLAVFAEDRVAARTHIRSGHVLTAYNDSDGIHNTAYENGMAIPVREDHAINLTIAEHVASAPDGSLFTDGRKRASVQEFAAGSDVLIAPGLHLSATAGGSTLRGRSLRPIYEVTLAGAPRDRWNIAIGTDRRFLTVTPRAIDREIASHDFFAGVTYWFDSRTSLAARVDKRLWSDTNHSMQGEAAFTRTLAYGKGFNLDAGVLTHQQAFRRNLLTVSGFFTPDHYSRYNGFLNTHGELKKLTWEIRGEGGKQQITTASNFQPNWAVTARASTRLSGALRLYASYERKNYSLLSRDGWYQGFYLSLTVQPKS